MIFKEVETMRPLVVRNKTAIYVEFTKLGPYMAQVQFSKPLKKIQKKI